MVSFLGTLNTRCRIIIGTQRHYNFDSHPIRSGLLLTSSAADLIDVLRATVAKHKKAMNMDSHH